MMMADHVRRALAAAHREDNPYPHWILRDVLPLQTGKALAELPLTPPAPGDIQGRRETINDKRIFASEENRARFPVLDDLARSFQEQATVAALEAQCGCSLEGGFLRIEYCLDTDGFWLEPHTDIGAKMFTMLVYLSEHPDAEHWGTDIFDAHGKLVKRASGAFNTGLIFIPAANTWHGFEHRPIRGIRRTLIINYVRPESRSRHELAFPSEPVRWGT
ncbi:hypothetical protein [Tepidiphilus baoligensis]|nr:hypothetical protein [Tepidiphilus baoligensis]